MRADSNLIENAIGNSVNFSAEAKCKFPAKFGKSLPSKITFAIFILLEICF